MTLPEGPHRLVFLINSLKGGGAERVAVTLANYFADVLQLSVTILMLEAGEMPYALSPNVAVDRLPVRRFAGGIGRVALLPLFAHDIARYLKQHRADAVISFLVRSNLILLLSELMGNRLPTHISERCITDLVYRGAAPTAFAMKLLIRLLYPRARSVIAISNGVRDSLVRLGIQPERIRVIYNPQNLDHIRQDMGKPHARSGGSFRLVTVGRLAPEKDVANALRALRLLLDMGRDVKLGIIGNGPDEVPLRNLAAMLRLGDRVRWHGWARSPYRVMSAADLFVMSSRHEGFGNALVEAMACGLPVVSTDCESGPREILDGGKYGLLVPVGDSTALAGAVARLMDDPTERARLCALGRQRAAQFDISVIGPQYLQVLRHQSPGSLSVA
jgi:glycosyltransferase involved in cell wall biosynthesis